MFKLKSFEEYVATRLTKEERDEVRKQAELEIKILKSMQSFISSSLDEYMEENIVGFNELVDKLKSSPSHLSKMRKGQANLTIGSFARVMATLGKDPQDMFKNKK